MIAEINYPSLKCGRPPEMMNPFCVTGTGVKAVIIYEAGQSRGYGDTWVSTSLYDVIVEKALHEVMSC